jgi:naphthalene 1,2-dioxygenase ferredoxin component
LVAGFVGGHDLRSPLHQGKFDVRSGKAMCAPLTTDVRTYPVKIEDGYVFVEV